MSIRENDHHHEQKIRRPALPFDSIKLLSWAVITAAFPLKKLRRRQAGDGFSAHCPKCGSRSFHMYDSSGKFHCYGCQDFYGDKLDYIKEVTGSSTYYQAAEVAAERFAIMDQPLPQTKKKKKTKPTENDLIIASFFKDPEILNAFGLTMTDGVVLCALLGLADGGTKATASREEVAQHARVRSVTTITTAIRNLRNAKLISTHRLVKACLRHGNARKDVYQFTINLSYLRDQQLRERRIN